MPLAIAVVSHKHLPLKDPKNIRDDLSSRRTILENWIVGNSGIKVDKVRTKVTAFWNDLIDRLKHQKSEGFTKMQVILHDGGPLKTDRQPQLVWVRVIGGTNELFSGVVLDKPAQLRTVRKGSKISFLLPKSGQYALQISSKYLEERPSWRLLIPCNQCGLSELLDPPSELIAKLFPAMTSEDLARGLTFTTRRGWCGGGLVVRIKRNHWP